MDLNRLPEDGTPVQPESDVFCSICLDPVNRNLERTVVQLKCYHKFHLDCIGSAFNAKMEMECPNCRNVEVGDWLFPSGNVPDPDDHWNNEEILHVEMIEQNHLPEMQAISIHWCPFEDVAPSTTHYYEMNIVASSYTHAQVQQWNGPSSPGEIQARVPTSGYTSHNIVAQQMDWMHPSLSLTTGGLNMRAEPISSSSPQSMHPFLYPQGVGPYDRGGQPSTRNFIDLVEPGTETGLHTNSINLRPFFATSTEQGHLPRRPYWQ